MRVRYTHYLGKYYFTVVSDSKLPIEGLRAEGNTYNFRMGEKEGKRFLEWARRRGRVSKVKPHRIYSGECLDTLRKLPESSVDCIVTDPPYGLTPVNPKGKKVKARGGFMGQKWDVDVPSTAIWRECLRVLRPGAFAFIMCAARQDCLAKLILRLKKAGFIVGFSSISWIYSSGMGKAKNLGKAADKRAGVEREIVGYDASRARPNRKYKSGAIGNVGGAATGRVSDRTDNGATITAPATDEAKRLDGSYAGFQPKPAFEPIVVVMKPLTESTYLDQAIANGKGCTWLDNCRIPNPSTHPNRYREGEKTKNSRYTKRGSTNFAVTPGPRGGSASGRFPANVLVEDKALDDGKVYSSGEMKNVEGGFGHANAKVYGTSRGVKTSVAKSSGGIYRYFDLDAWFEHRIDQLPEEAWRTFPFLYVAKPSPKEKNLGLDTPNIHPTVKSIRLMSYLTVLGSRQGELILDPFAGSGTTGIAATMQSRRFIGCERNLEYVEIAERRIDYASGHPTDEVLEKAAGKEKTKRRPKRKLF